MTTFVFRLYRKYKLIHFGLTLTMLVVLMAPTSAQAAKDRLQELIVVMQNVYDQTQSYSADFEQLTGTANSSKPKKAAGTVAFAKPGKMRWDYSTPQKAFISNGTTFWMVQPDQNEVLEMPAKQAFGSRTPMAFLAGIGKLQDEFKPELIAENKGSATIKLVLKQPTSQAQYLMMKIDTGTGLAQSVKTVDFFGAYNELRFSNYELKTKFASDYFTFKAPRGMRVVKPGKALPSNLQKSKK